MAAFSRAAFDTNAFSVNAWDFGSAVDTHDGGDDVKKRRKGRGEEIRASKAQMRQMITYAFDKAYGLLPPELAEVREVVAPFVEAQGRRVEIDWEAIRQDVTTELKLKALYAEYAYELAERDDEDAIMVLH